jgi:phage gp36-like protein
MSDKAVTVTKRGRPPKGECPMTDSERKRDQRMRDKRATIDAIGDEQNAPLRALLAILGRVDALAAARLCAQRAWAEIGRRYGFVSVTEQACVEETPSRNKE